MRSKPIIIGCAFTGARFNISASDSAVRAKYMPLSPQQNIAEAIQVYQLGARYMHFHARNPNTGEQFADSRWYQEVCQGMRQHLPMAVISFGSSRHGREVLQAIQDRGEIARSCGLEAKPDYFTNFAAVEIAMFDSRDNRDLSDNLHPRNIQQHYRTVVHRMNELLVCQEVEITTYPKSLAALEKIKDNPNLGLLYPLNMVILLGFSSLLPISKQAYDEVVERSSKLLEGRVGTITIGSVIRPHESTELDPSEVLDWCLQDDRVSAFRTGIEDSPALGGIQKTNPELVEYAVKHCQEKGVPIQTDSTEVRKTMHLLPKALPNMSEHALA